MASADFSRKRKKPSLAAFNKDTDMTAIQAKMMTFDLTLKGYDEIFNNMKDDVISVRTDRLGNDLVKWINAPSKEAIDRFVKRHRLDRYLDCKVEQMNGKEWGDGTDLQLNEKGEVVKGGKKWREKWVKLVQDTAQSIATDKHQATSPYSSTDETLKRSRGAVSKEI
jgi:hypothetical protein